MKKTHFRQVKKKHSERKTIIWWFFPLLFSVRPFDIKHTACFLSKIVIFSLVLWKFCVSPKTIWHWNSCKIYSTRLSRFCEKRYFYSMLKPTRLQCHWKRDICLQPSTAVIHVSTDWAEWNFFFEWGFLMRYTFNKQISTSDKPFVIIQKIW